MGGEGGVVTQHFFPGQQERRACYMSSLNHNSLDNCLVGVLHASPLSHQWNKQIMRTQTPNAIDWLAAIYGTLGIRLHVHFFYIGADVFCCLAFVFSITVTMGSHSVPLPVARGYALDAPLGGRFQMPGPLTGCPATPSKCLDGHTERLMKKYPRIHTDQKTNKQTHTNTNTNVWGFSPTKSHVTSFDSWILFWVFILL